MKKFWLAVCAFFVLHAHAEINQEPILVADAGGIKTAANDTKTSMKKWAQLTKQEKQVLAPLASEWDTLRAWQRERMLDIAKDYPRMDAKNNKGYKSGSIVGAE